MPPFLLGQESPSIKGKCLTPYIINPRLQPTEHLELRQSLLSGRPQTDVSILSPGGKFRIHFDTSSANQHLPAMVDGNGNRIANSHYQYADTVAQIFDSVWRAEITTFRFVPPPSDSAGGGNEYDIYIQDLGPNNFGYTQPETTFVVTPGKMNPRLPSYIVIDNDFGYGFRTKGVAGARVTAAHEFFHAIQVGGYGTWFDDFYFYEMTAESMEPVVFPSVKDYVNDIKAYFNNIESIPLYASGSYPGYERAIWGVYLTQRYGIQLMAKIWERVELERPMPAMVNAFTLENISLPQAFASFTLWNFFTGVRADTILYYKDGNLFPPLNFSETRDITAGVYTYLRTAKSYTMQYVRAVRSSDTVDFKISNVNTADALADSHQVFNYSLGVAPDVVSGWSALPNGISYNFNVSSPFTWKVLVGADSVGIFSPLNASPFPNPFRPKDTPAIYFPIPSSRVSEITLYIFSSSLELQTQMIPQYDYERKSVRWDGRNSKGEFVASGIYFYILKGEGIEVKGKFAVVQ